MACRVLVPQTVIKPVTPALKTWNLNHWTREGLKPGMSLFIFINSIHCIPALCQAEFSVLGMQEGAKKMLHEWCLHYSYNRHWSSRHNKLRILTVYSGGMCVVGTSCAGSGSGVLRWLQGRLHWEGDIGATLKEVKGFVLEDGVWAQGRARLEAEGRAGLWDGGARWRMNWSGVSEADRGRRGNLSLAVLLVMSLGLFKRCCLIHRKMGRHGRVLNRKLIWADLAFSLKKKIIIMAVLGLHCCARAFSLGVVQGLLKCLWGAALMTRQKWSEWVLPTLGL